MIDLISENWLEIIRRHDKVSGLNHLSRCMSLFFNRLTSAKLAWCLSPERNPSVDFQVFPLVGMEEKERLRPEELRPVFLYRALH
jgi:hypothetical protein